MSGIRETEKLGQRQIETSKRRNERELKKMEAAHSELKADLKKTHELEVVDIQDANHAHIDKEAQKKEKVLAEMRTHLQQTRDMTEKELKALKTNSSQERAELQQKHSIDRERINSENQLHLEDINDRYTQASKKVNVEGQKRIEDAKLHMNDEKRNLQSFHQERINKQTEDFTTRFNHDGRNYKKMKDDQDNSFKKERMSTNVRQQHELNKMTTNHTSHIETRDTEYRKGLKEQDLFFEKKYEKQLTQHNSDFKMLEDKNKKVVDDLKTSLTKEISTFASRNDDPFYKFEALKPRMKQFEDRVEIEVDVPEHSKTDVALTTHGKEAIISFNRRYNDASKQEDGTINKVNKVESFTTRLATNHILDAKSAKSSYDNGVMTYVIKKA